ncbi:hypothetical protein BJF85_01450 [Saccharomonospora sp. CUA-673]|nr:hypothetical protein BJF85_01450 [Saccharomonospora sp. CUA-673]
MSAARQPSRSRWRTPVALGLAAAALLGGTAWASKGLTTGDEPNRAAMAMPAATDRATSQPAESSSERPTTTSPTPSSSTSTAPPSTSSEQPSTTSQQPPPPPPTPTPEPCSTDLEGTQPHVAQVGNHVLTQFDVDSVGGVASRSGASDHPSGLALDFMTTGENGDRIAEYVLANQAEFGVTYVIWAQQYNDGSGWSMMEDRGSDTANHYDHVHVSFAAGAEVDVSC